MFVPITHRSLLLHLTDSQQLDGQLYYGPFVAADYPGLIGTKEHTKYGVVFSNGRIGFPHGTKILSTESLGHNGTEELATWRSIDQDYIEGY